MKHTESMEFTKSERNLVWSRTPRKELSYCQELLVYINHRVAKSSQSLDIYQSTVWQIVHKCKLEVNIQLRLVHRHRKQMIGKVRTAKLFKKSMELINISVLDLVIHKSWRMVAWSMYRWQDFTKGVAHVWKTPSVLLRKWFVAGWN